ncbi:MAG TPA: hypothetical protein VHD85_01650 [Terracidiphilus sp.]|nr:hypothetical protein [Terracidiphilus sp.]
MHKRLTLALSILAACVPLRAQWAVVDADAIAQLTKQVSQGAQQIQQLTNQYNQMKAMAVQAQGLFRYRGPQTIWQDFRYADQYATLALWATGANSGDQNTVQQAYSQSTILADVDQTLTKINAGVANSRRAMYATQAVMDGNNLAAMTAVGQIHQAAMQYQTAIAALENDAQNADPAVQSQLAVEQRTSNAALLQLRSTQDTNNLLSQIALQQVAQSKLTRDSLAADTNQAIANQQSYDALDALENGMADSWLNWKVVGR